MLHAIGPRLYVVHGSHLNHANEEPVPADLAALPEHLDHVDALVAVVQVPISRTRPWPADMPAGALAV